MQLAEGQLKEGMKRAAARNFHTAAVYFRVLESLLPTLSSEIHEKMQVFLNSFFCLLFFAFFNFVRFFSFFWFFHHIALLFFFSLSKTYDPYIFYNNFTLSVHLYLNISIALWELSSVHIYLRTSYTNTLRESGLRVRDSSSLTVYIYRPFLCFAVILSLSLSCSSPLFIFFSLSLSLFPSRHIWYIRKANVGERKLWICLSMQTSTIG